MLGACIQPDGGAGPEPPLISYLNKSCRIETIYISIKCTYPRQVHPDELHEQLAQLGNPTSHFAPISYSFCPYKQYRRVTVLPERSKNSLLDLIDLQNSPALSIVVVVFNRPRLTAPSAWILRKTTAAMT